MSEKKNDKQEGMFSVWIIKQISLIYKEPTEKNTKKNETNRIKGKGYEKTAQKGMQIANKCTKRCSTLFIIKEVQIK